MYVASLGADVASRHHLPQAMLRARRVVRQRVDLRLERLTRARLQLRLPRGMERVSRNLGKKPLALDLGQQRVQPLTGSA